MRIVKEDVQDKIDALNSTMADLNDQLEAAEGNADKQASIKDKIISTQEKIDKLKGAEKESTVRSGMRIIRED
jgi:hypothetical protein